jgi:phosphotransferase system HPr-like phosphotransfer protein
MLSLLGGGIKSGSQIVVAVDGEDEQETLDALCNLIEQFDE